MQRKVLIFFAALSLLAGCAVGRLELTPLVSSNSVEQSDSAFHSALEPYGRWIIHPRWGQVWIPANVPDGWRPYTVGHWENDSAWGHVWVSDEEWGRVPYHYGRWIFDPDLSGWAWVPGTEWGAAWVRWRQGTDTVGWSPLPPDPVVVEIEREPRTWIFVRRDNFLAPRISTLVLSAQQTNIYFRQTVVAPRITIIVRPPAVTTVQGSALHKPRPDGGDAVGIMRNASRVHLSRQLGSGGTVHVGEYHRKDGTLIHAYTRRAPSKHSGKHKH
jgi:hypothetical protein